MKIEKNHRHLGVYGLIVENKKVLLIKKKARLQYLTFLLKDFW